MHGSSRPYSYAPGDFGSQSTGAGSGCLEGRRVWPVAWLGPGGRGPVARSGSAGSWLAGVGDAGVHDGRHTAGTLLLEQGVDIRVVEEILGHSDLRVTQGYTHVASVLAHDAAARIGRPLFGVQTGGAK